MRIKLNQSRRRHVSQNTHLNHRGISSAPVLTIEGPVLYGILVHDENRTSCRVKGPQMNIFLRKIRSKHDSFSKIRSPTMLTSQKPQQSNKAIVPPSTLVLVQDTPQPHNRAHDAPQLSIPYILPPLPPESGFMVILVHFRPFLTQKLSSSLHTYHII